MALKTEYTLFCTQVNFVTTCKYKTSHDLATDGPIFVNLVSKDA